MRLLAFESGAAQDVGPGEPALTDSGHPPHLGHDLGGTSRQGLMIWGVSHRCFCSDVIYPMSGSSWRAWNRIEMSPLSSRLPSGFCPGCPLARVGLTEMSRRRNGMVVTWGKRLRVFVAYFGPSWCCG